MLGTRANHVHRVRVKRSIFQIGDIEMEKNDWVEEIKASVEEAKVRCEWEANEKLNEADWNHKTQTDQFCQKVKLFGRPPWEPPASQANYLAIISNQQQ